MFDCLNPEIHRIHGPYDVFLHGSRGEELHHQELYLPSIRVTSLVFVVLWVRPTVMLSQRLIWLPDEKSSQCYFVVFHGDRRDARCQHSLGVAIAQGDLEVPVHFSREQVGQYKRVDTKKRKQKKRFDKAGHRETLIGRTDKKSKP